MRRPGLSPVALARAREALAPFGAFREPGAAPLDWWRTSELRDNAAALVRANGSARYAPARRTPNPFDGDLDPRHGQLMRLQDRFQHLADRYSRALVNETVGPAEWLRTMFRDLDRYLHAAGQLGAGHRAIEADPAFALLDGYRAGYRQRFASLLADLESGAATPAQFRARVNQVARGAVWTASQALATQWLDGPVVRVLGSADHCGTCPGKAGRYDSLAECLRVCGGLPGDGSDQCHGHCHCSLRPAERRAA